MGRSCCPSWPPMLMAESARSCVPVHLPWPTTWEHLQSLCTPGVATWLTSFHDAGLTAPSLPLQVCPTTILVTELPPQSAIRDCNVCGPDVAQPPSFDHQ